MTVNTASKIIAKNAGVLLVSQLLTWVLTLLLTIFLPRYLGAVNSGKIVLANSIWAIAAIFITFGMDTLLTKQIARDHTQAPKLFGLTLVSRVLLFGGVGALVAVYTRVANYPAETLVVVAIGALTALFWQFVSATQATLQGLERMGYMSLGNVIGKAFNTLVCIAMLLMGQGVYVVAAVAAIAALINFAIQFSALRRIVPIRLNVDMRALAHMLKDGLPYLMSGLFLVAYGQVDVIVISLLVNEQTVGWYGAASQLFGTSFFIPTVFITAVFPALSRMYASASDALPRLMRKSFDLLLIVSIPIGLGLFALADPLVVLLFGQDFAPSGPLLALLGFVLIVTYQNMLIGQFLISTDRQNRWTLVMAVATLATIPLDLALIPYCQAMFGNGAIGGALSFLITEIGMLVFGLMLLPKGSLDRSNVWLAVRAALAGIVMMLAAYSLRAQFILVPIVAGALVYGVLVLALGVISRQDLALMQRVVAGMTSRLARPVPSS